uniref:Uncharacterized protein n=1 Tax=Glossina brevipalpis TaxID=37001 RepID=A0A1A9WDD2_9MUSC
MDKRNKINELLKQSIVNVCYTTLGIVVVDIVDDKSPILSTLTLNGRDLSNIKSGGDFEPMPCKPANTGKSKFNACRLCCSGSCSKCVVAVVVIVQLLGIGVADTAVGLDDFETILVPGLRLDQSVPLTLHERKHQDNEYAERRVLALITLSKKSSTQYK